MAWDQKNLWKVTLDFNLDFKQQPNRNVPRVFGLEEIEQGRMK
jgi:hypothetical protein